MKYIVSGAVLAAVCFAIFRIIYVGFNKFAKDMDIKPLFGKNKKKKDNNKWHW